MHRLTRREPDRRRDRADPWRARNPRRRRPPRPRQAARRASRPGLRPGAAAPLVADRRRASTGHAGKAAGRVVARAPSRGAASARTPRSSTRSTRVRSHLAYPFRPGLSRGSLPGVSDRGRRGAAALRHARPRGAARCHRFDSRHSRRSSSTARSGPARCCGSKCEVADDRGSFAFSLADAAPTGAVFSSGRGRLEPTRERMRADPRPRSRRAPSPNVVGEPRPDPPSLSHRGRRQRYGDARDPRSRSAETYAFVDLLRLPENRGKGFALKAGYRAARARGYSHVVQLDGDGQHDPADVPRFVEAIRAHPEAMVLGVPIFDESAPRARLWARQISRVRSLDGLPLAGGSRSAVRVPRHPTRARRGDARSRANGRPDGVRARAGGSDGLGRHPDRDGSNEGRLSQGNPSHFSIARDYPAADVALRATDRRACWSAHRDSGVPCGLHGSADEPGARVVASRRARIDDRAGAGWAGSTESSGGGSRSSFCTPSWPTSSCASVRRATRPGVISSAYGRPPKVAATCGAVRASFRRSGTTTSSRSQILDRMVLWTGGIGAFKMHHRGSGTPARPCAGAPWWPASRRASGQLRHGPRVRRCPPVHSERGDVHRARRAHQPLLREADLDQSDPRAPTRPALGPNPPSRSGLHRPRRAGRDAGRSDSGRADETARSSSSSSAAQSRSRARPSCWRACWGARCSSRCACAPARDPTRPSSSRSGRVAASRGANARRSPRSSPSTGFGDSRRTACVIRTNGSTSTISGAARARLERTVSAGFGADPACRADAIRGIGARSPCGGHALPGRPGAQRALLRSRRASSLLGGCRIHGPVRGRPWRAGRA